MGMENKSTDSSGGNNPGAGATILTPASTTPPTREQMREIYRKVVARDPQPKSRQKGRSYLQAQVINFLSSVEHVSKFCRQVSDTIDRSIREVHDWDPEEAAEAFLAVEKYALNVLDYPWKNEFKVVKMYTGFYCGRVAPHLRGAVDLFKMMGYEQLDASRLVLKRISSSENLLYVACECYIAALECMLMMRVLERVEVVNYVLSDVYRSRRECPGNVDMAVLWITDNCEPCRTQVALRQREPVEKAERERQEKENRRYEVGYNHRPHEQRDRRWEQYDDRLSPVHGYGYGFGYQNRNLALGHTTYDSMGRPVRGLNDSGGVQSAAGSSVPNASPSLIAHGGPPPHNAAAQRKDNMDSGVLSMETSACAGRLSRHSQYNNHGYYDGMRYSDESDGGSSFNLPESASDYDLYAAGTIDDHLQRSLLYIQRMDTGPKSLKETQPALSSLKDDWGDVRENLRSKYGDKYFEGERGDILKANPDRDELICGDLGDNLVVGTDGQPPPYKAVVEPQTKQRYDNVLQEISGKLPMRRVPTPSPPNSATLRRSPPATAYQSPPLTHRSPPPPPPQSSQQSPYAQAGTSPPQAAVHNPALLHHQQTGMQPISTSSLTAAGGGAGHHHNVLLVDPSTTTGWRGMMPSILENSSDAVIMTSAPTSSPAALLLQQQQNQNFLADSGECSSGHFPPPPSDLTVPGHGQPLASLEEEEEEEEEVEDDDMPPPPPESVDGVREEGDRGAKDGGHEKTVTNDKSNSKSGSCSPLATFGFCLASGKQQQEQQDYDDARFAKPRFQSFGMEDGEFLLKRERGPSPPPRLFRAANGSKNHNGMQQRPGVAERRSFYENVDSDSNMSSPLGTSSTFSSSADTVVAAAERLAHSTPTSTLVSPGLTSSNSNSQLLQQQQQQQQQLQPPDDSGGGGSGGSGSTPGSSPGALRRHQKTPTEDLIVLASDEIEAASHDASSLITAAVVESAAASAAVVDNDLGVPLRRLNVKSASYEEERKKSSTMDALLNDPQRPKSVGFAAEEAAKWQCDTCTFKNAASLSVCEICGRSRDLGPDLESVIGAGPQCLYCTLVNAKGSKLCDACGADLEGCATYI